MAHFADGSTLNFGGATPTGNFVPEIFSKKVQEFFRIVSTVEAVTNNEYFGEISEAGDSVRVIKEPTITVAPYNRNTTVTPQSLADDELTLVLDQANHFAFKVDDIETKISHIDWQSLASNSGAYSLSDAYDKEVLTYMSTDTAGRILAANVVNDTEYANLVNLTAADDLLNQMSNLARRLDEQNVPQEGRFIILPPAAMEVLAKADSKLLNMDFNGNAMDLSNGLAFSQKLRGFAVYVTNNCPTFDTLTTVETHHVMLAGHMSAVATAQAITKTETYRDQNTFADIVRGLHVYGREVIRPEALAIARVTYTGADLTP